MRSYLLFGGKYDSGARVRLCKADVSSSDTCAASCRTTKRTSCKADITINLSFFLVACASHQDKVTSNRTKPFVDPLFKSDHSRESVGTFFKSGQSVWPILVLGCMDLYQVLHSAPNFSMSLMMGNNANSPDDFPHFLRTSGRNFASKLPLQWACSQTVSSSGTKSDQSRMNRPQLYPTFVAAVPTSPRLPPILLLSPSASNSMPLSSPTPCPSQPHDQVHVGKLPCRLVWD